MAKTKTKKDSTLPLVIALVFFVITTIAFGIMWYTTNDQIAGKEEAVKAADKKVADLRAAQREAELTTIVYKAYIGVASTKELEDIGQQIKDGDKPSDTAVKALKQLNDSVRTKELALAGGGMGGMAEGKMEGAEGAAPAAAAGPTKLAYWPPEFDGNKTLRVPPEALTKGGLIGVYTQMAADLSAADERAKKAVANYTPAAAAANEKGKAFDTEREKYSKESATVTNKYVDKATEARVAADANRVKFDKEASKGRGDVKKLMEEIDGLKLEIDRLKAELSLAQKNNVDIQERLKTKTDVFQYDEPQGRITRRVNEDVVEIDLGWLAKVRPGLTFTVLPRDFPEKGRQSRMQMLRIQDAKGNFHSVERFVPKATLEVIEILGPNSSRARIAGEDAIRDKVLPGDLLYNSIWRKGQADHVALVGVFDVNGDGSDDIETVVKDLTRMGVPVDAVFDLRTQKWVGRITEQTRYVIQGAFPTNSGVDPNREAKTKLLEALAAAMGDARAKGVTVSNYRDFFPRMGYRVKQDVSEDKINQAASKYLSGGVLGQPDGAPNP
jgi:hypothetical protein